jgi:hypothetical protein
MLEIVENFTGRALFCLLATFNCSVQCERFAGACAQPSTALHRASDQWKKEILCTLGALSDYLLAVKQVPVKHNAQDQTAKEHS